MSNESQMTAASYNMKNRHI